MTDPTASLDARKLDDPEGTYEDNAVAFQLWLGKRAPIFGAFGYHCVPHIGVYGDEYTPALPIALVSFTVSDGQYDALLPPSVAAILWKCEDRALIVPGRVELLLHIHSGIVRQPCSHFLCDRDNEFNLMAHPWIFAADDVANGSDEISARAFIGVFEPCGVEERHRGPLCQEQLGAPIGWLADLEVLLHDRRFSPHNATLGLSRRGALPASAAVAAAAQAAAEAAAARHASGLPPLPPVHDPTPSVVVFFSVVVDATLAASVVTLHVLPVDNDVSADAVRGWMRGLETFGQLLDALHTHVPAAARHVDKMLFGGSARAATVTLGGGAGTASGAAAPS